MTQETGSASKVTPTPGAPLLAGALLVLFAALTIWLVNDHTDRVRWVEHSLQLERSISDVQTTFYSVESGARGYLLDGNPRFLSNYTGAVQAIDAKLEAVRAQTQDNPAYRDFLRDAEAAGGQRLGQLKRAVDLKKAGQDKAAVQVLAEQLSVRNVRYFRDTTERMLAEENRLLAIREQDAERANIALLIASLLTGAATLAFTFLWMRNAVRANRALEEAYAELSASAASLRSEVETREEAENQVRQMQKMEAIGQLTGGIAHDFNNMLAVIIGNLNLIERKLAKGETNIHRNATAALEGASRAAALTARLLAFSRLQPLAPQPVDLNRLVLNLSDVLRRTLGEQVRIETVQGAGLWQARVDPVQLESAILNLAVNARDAMDGQGRLTIETANAFLDEAYAKSAGLSAGQYVMIAVSDTGAGMALEVVEKAFDPFFTTKPAGKGTGLGLSQVYGFIKQTHGHIKIYSEPGQGTTIKIYLPRLVGSEAVHDPVKAPAPEIAGKPDEIVLVVEDEDRVRQFAVEALRDLGYTVLHASGASEALIKLRSQPGVSLLLTDIIMPEKTGRQLAESAAEIVPNLPVLYMTGFSRNAVVHNGMLDPGVNFLAKPFTLDQLGAKVREVLDAGG